MANDGDERKLVNRTVQAAWVLHAASARARAGHRGGRGEGQLASRSHLLARMSCDERRRGRCTSGESPADLLPRLCQFAVVVGWRGGERAFAGEGTGGYGGGGEQIAMDDCRMFARRRPRTINSGVTAQVCGTMALAHLANVPVRSLLCVR